MKVTNLRVNHLINPIGFLFEKTVFSYQVEGADGKKQQSAQIRVATDETMINIIADTGMSMGVNSLATELKVDLQPRSRYFWNVTVISDAGEESVSETAYFETAKMGEGWTANWIASDRAKDAKTGRQPSFVKDFSLSKKVKSARLYITGLGLYNATINGKKVTEEKLTPFCNDYNEWVQYQTFDVTTLLEKENHMSVAIGDGWYKGRFGFSSRPNEKGFYGDDYKMIMELHLLYTDGSEEVIISDDSWKVERTKYTFSNIYDGEKRDDTLESLPLEDVIVIDASYEIEDEYKPCNKLVERMSVPVIAHEEIKPIELINTPAGEKVYDVGQNMAGGFRLHVNAPKGTAVHVQVGEVLQQGNFYNENLRSAKAEYFYVSDGVEKDIEPEFTFYGYRYAKVEGLDNLTVSDFTAIAYYSDFTPVGEIETGHEKINQLLSNVKWGQKGNFIDVPTDCPQRDERMGWTADTQVFVPTASYFTDSYAFYRKYLYDMRKEQSVLDGAIPDVVPSAGVAASNSSVWGDAVTIIPWTLYEYSGDKTILEESLDSMAAWVDKVCEIDGDDHGYRRIFHYGDWLALDNPRLAKDTTAGGTEEGYIGDIYHMYSAELTAKAAKIVGREDVAKKYSNIAEKLRLDIQDEYFTATGRCAITTMTGYLLALRHNLTSDKKAVEEKLIKLLAAKGNKLQTGFVGTPFLCQELSKAGEDKTAYEVLLNEEYPGWLYEINLGATTVWERWNSMEADGFVSSTGMNSFNHYAYGSIAEWMWKTIAGINFAEPGFKKAYIRMIPDLTIDHANASYNSVAGRYVTSWEIIDNTHVKMHVEVPFDCSAEIELFDPKDEEKLRMVEAGVYDFEYELAHSLKKIYSVDTPIGELFNDIQVYKMIEKNMPELLRVPASMQSMSIRTLSGNMGGEMPQEQLEQINAMLASV